MLRKAPLIYPLLAVRPLLTQADEDQPSSEERLRLKRPRLRLTVPHPWAPWHKRRCHPCLDWLPRETGDCALRDRTVFLISHVCFWHLADSLRGLGSRPLSGLKPT